MRSLKPVLRRSAFQAHRTVLVDPDTACPVTIASLCSAFQALSINHALRKAWKGDNVCLRLGKGEQNLCNAVRDLKPVLRRSAFQAHLTVLVEPDTACPVTIATLCSAFQAHCIFVIGEMLSGARNGQPISFFGESAFQAVFIHAESNLLLPALLIAD